MKKCLILLLGMFFLTATALASEFPSKPVTHIIPAKAGGGI